MSTLSINVSSGLLHKSYDIIGKMENYVYFKLVADGRTQEYRTKIVAGEKKKPIVWNETVNIPVPKSGWNNAVLSVQIRDQDVTTDDVCGKGIINLQHCGFFQQQRATIPYQIRLYEAKNQQVAGELNFTSTLN